MPRTARQVEDNRYYHILTRGNNRKRIFRCNQDYLYFMKLLPKIREKHKIAICNYCLMANHLHFLVKSVESGNFPRFFQVLFQTYASYFRKRYNHVGYLFQNRYKSILIAKESYLLDCARYIERNPLRANIATDLSEYKWSSFLYYGYGERDAIISELNPLYMNLAPADTGRREMYRSYILEDRPYEHIVDKGVGIR